MLYGLETEASSSSQRPVTFHQTSWRHIHKDANLRKLLRLHFIFFIFSNTIKVFWPHSKLTKSFFLPSKFNQCFIKIYISNISRNRFQKEGRQLTYNNTWARSCIHCCWRKAKYITYSESVLVASGIQHTICTRHIVTCSLPNSTRIFPLYIIKKQFSEKKMVTEHEVCVLICSTFILNISHSMRMCARCDQKRIRLPVKLHLLSDCNETWIFSTNIRKILNCQIAWKSVQWEPSCSLPKDRQTDMTKLIVAFRNFTNTPNGTNKLENWKGFARRVLCRISRQILSFV
jgi:hypothetical protein